MTSPDRVARALRVLGWMSVSVVAPAWFVTPVVGQDANAGVQYAEIQPGVGVSAELGGTGGFGEAVVFSVFFYSDSSALTASVTTPGGIEDRSVFEIAEGEPTAVTLEVCQLVDGAPVCDPLDQPARTTRREDGDGRGVFLAIRIPGQRIDWNNGFLRLSMEAGRYRLSVLGPDATSSGERDSPAITNATLPTLAKLEQQYLEQRPFLDLAATPLIRGQTTGEGGFDDLGLSFTGGLFRFLRSGNTRLQLTWSGEVATGDSVAFNHLTLDAGLERNIWPGDWLPLGLSVRGQSDQRVDAFDLSANASLAFVLPFNLNLQSGSYRPALSPRLKLLAGYGNALKREAASLEQRFSRVGYEVRWRVPVGEGNLVRLHHANVWNNPTDDDAAWHTLWDVQIDVAVGGMTYFIGYQNGAAAPLFTPIETTRVGLSFAFGVPMAPDG